MSTIPKNELEDFEAFLEPSFDALQFANGLLLATNDNENELDVITPTKKLRFDIDECEKRMSKIATNNYEPLVSKFTEIGSTRDIAKDQIGPQLQHLNLAFQRVKEGLMTPYEDAVKLNKSLKKIHATLNLLRGAGFFMYLAQQIEDGGSIANKKSDHTNSDSSSTSRDIIRLAKVHTQLSKLYESSNRGAVNLLSIKLIRDYQSIYISKRADLSSHCVSIISNDFTHTSTFTNTNTQLHDAIVALYTLDAKECLATIERATINKHTQTICSQLSKALQSPRNFNSTLEDVFESSENFLTKTALVLEEAKVSDNRSFLVEFLKFFDAQSLAKLYWSRLSFKFKKNVAATMARGGPIAKNLKIYHEGIKKSVTETFAKSEGSPYIMEAIDIIGGLQ
ncbi:conserved oligomeric Golgi complex subunit 5 [[Candida] anglica]|uniref:Conserved oligomeric Golgi complex subunit 5 n=1 Tax=[Candida] anglica TaxID=148631 RepID=A0ABP0EI11_9ASCO